MANTPEVEANVRIIPQKRTATYAIPLTERKADDLKAAVNTKSIVLSGGIGRFSDSKPEIPKTLAAVVAAQSLLSAVYQELVEQGIAE